MAQHDLVIDNAPGQPVRLDMQAALQALATCSCGPVEPATKYPGQLWLDTSFPPDGVMRQRNQANTAWTALLFSAQLLPFISPDMSILGRTSPNRLVVNDAANGTGTDIMSISETGLMKIPANAVQPVGAVVPRVYGGPTSGVWTKPVGCKFILVEIWGAGGGGGGAAGTVASQGAAGAGGGAGGYVRKLYDAASLTTLSYVVADGGAGGGSTSSGVTAANCNFGPSLVVTGGQGGAGCAAQGTNGGNTYGGTGGVGSGGDMNAAGAYGGNGIPVPYNFSASFGGKGGDGPMGGGALPLYGTSNGNVAVGYGGGGGGACTGASQTAKAGGKGSAGLIWVTEFY